MSKLIKIEKALFYFLVFAGFWQMRLVLTLAGRQFNEWTSFYFYATDFIIIAILILWGVRLKSDFKGSPKSDFSRFANIALFLFLLFSALSLFIAQDKALGFYRLIKLLEFAGLYFYVRYNFIKLFNWQKLWQCFIAGAVLQSFAAIAQFFTQKSLGLKFFAESPIGPNIDGAAKIVVNGVKIVRAYGLVPHPNILAAILMIAIFGLVWLWLEKFSTPSFSPPHRERGRWRGWVFLIAILAMALFFTFSRSVIVVGYISLLGWLIYSWRIRAFRRRIFLIGILLFIVNCLLLIVFWPYVSSRYDLAVIGGSQALNLRQFYNQAALDFIKKSPILGIGLGNFVSILAETYNKLPPWIFQPVHNIYLLIASETGVLGLLAFLAFLFLTVKSAWSRRCDLSVSCLLFIVCCLLFLGLFDHFLWDLQQGQILFWLVLGLLSAHSSMDRTQASEA